MNRLSVEQHFLSMRQTKAQICQRAGISLVVFDEARKRVAQAKARSTIERLGRSTSFDRLRMRAALGLGQPHDLQFNAVLARGRGRLPAGVAPIDEGDLDAVVGGYPASIRFTDRLLGSLANKLPGSSSIQSVTACLKDIAEFYAYGGKSNGCGLCTSNLLSSITAVSGTNTAGYTLAQWQAFYLVCNANKGAQPGHSPHQRGGRGRASVRHQQEDAGRDPLAAERHSLPD